MELLDYQSPQNHLINMAETKAPAKKSLPATLHLLSGAISGTASVLALQPLDREL